MPHDLSRRELLQYAGLLFSMTTLRSEPFSSGSNLNNQSTENASWFGQYQLRGSILVIKDNQVSASGFLSFGTDMTTIPTSPTTGTGVYIDYRGIYGLNAGVQQFYLQASDGKAYAGGGAVILDATGITISAGGAPTSVFYFKDSSSITISDWMSYESGGIVQTLFSSYGSAGGAGGSNPKASLILRAEVDSGTSNGGLLELFYDNSITAHYANFRGATTSDFAGVWIGKSNTRVTPTAMLDVLGNVVIDGLTSVIGHTTLTPFTGLIYLENNSNNQQASGLRVVNNADTQDFGVGIAVINSAGSGQNGSDAYYAENSDTDGGVAGTLYGGNLYTASGYGLNLAITVGSNSSKNSSRAVYLRTDTTVRNTTPASLPFLVNLEDVVNGHSGAGSSHTRLINLLGNDDLIHAHPNLAASGYSLGNFIILTEETDTTALYKVSMSGRVSINTPTNTFPLEVQADSSAEGIRIIGRSSGDLGSLAFANNALSAQYQIFGNDKGVSFGGTPQFGGGSGVISLINATATPSSNPSGGGVLYAEGGALKWRGSGGTVTTIAPA